MSIHPLSEMSKFFNRKTVFDGIVFDSRKEAERYAELRLMEKAGVITNLRRQVRFELIPNQYMDGKLIERRVDYLADFVYRDAETDKTVVEDVKSPATKTDKYIIKRKLLLKLYGIRIREV